MFKDNKKSCEKPRQMGKLPVHFSLYSFFEHKFYSNHQNTKNTVLKKMMQRAVRLRCFCLCNVIFVS